jgi:hypothetical protein
MANNNSSQSTMSWHSQRPHHYISIVVKIERYKTMTYKFIWKQTLKFLLEWILINKIKQINNELQPFWLKINSELKNIKDSCYESQ